MNLLLLLTLAVPLSCLAFLSALALLGIMTLGAVVHVLGHKGLASNEQQPYPVGTSVDHLIGEREQRDQRIETEPLSSLEIRVRTH